MADRRPQSVGRQIRRQILCDKPSDAAGGRVRRLYRIRAQIEEVIRLCKGQLGLTGCQARSLRAHEHHILCCLVAFCLLERESHDRGVSTYQLKRHLSFRGRAMVIPALERLRTAA